MNNDTNLNMHCLMAGGVITLLFFTEEDLQIFLNNLCEKHQQMSFKRQGIQKISLDVFNQLIQRKFLYDTEERKINLIIYYIYPIFFSSEEYLIDK